MIAITGASGLLGQHLVGRLADEGHTVTAVVRKQATVFPQGVTVREADILDPMELAVALQGADTVIHAAALVSFNPRRKDEIYAVNVDGTRNLVNVCLREGIPTIVHISSVAALGRKPDVAITETEPWSGLYANDYARSKYLAELEIFRGGEEGLTVSMVNPSVILSGQPLHRSSASLFDYAWKERAFYTSGMLNYVDIRDVADAVITLLRSPQPGERFTLNGGRIPYPDFFRQLARRWNKRAPFLRSPGPMVTAFGLMEELRGLLTGREPQVTRHSAAMTTRQFQYDTTKATQRLQLKFRALDDTLDWCCARYQQDVTGNK